MPQNTLLPPQVGHPASDGAADRLFALALDLLCAIGPDTRLVCVNPAFERTLGWTPDELLGQSFLDIVHPDDRARAEAEWARVAAGEPVERFQARLRCRHGGHRWFSMRATPPDDRALVYAVGRDVTACRHAEEAARESEARLARSERRFRAVVERASERISIVDERGVLLYLNPAFRNTLGLAYEQALGVSAFEFIHPDDRRDVAARFAEVLHQPAGVGRAEYRVRRTDGSWRTITTSAINLIDDPAVGGVVLTSRDVTDERDAIAALRTSERFNEVVLASTPDCIKLLDLDGRLEFMSASGLRAFGVDDFARLRGVEWASLRSGESATRARAAVTRARGGEVSRYEDSQVTASGEHLWVEVTVSPVRDEGGAVAKLLVVSRDITEAKRAESRLRESEARFRALIENSSDMIAVLDARGVHRYASPAHVRYMGFAPEEMVGRMALELVHPEDAPMVGERLARLIAEPGTTETVRFRHRHKDGAWRTVESVGTNLVDDPAVAGIVVNSRDVTEQEELAAQLRQAQKMEAVGRLAGGVAHDFNNLLMVIQSYGDALRAELPEGSGAREDVLEMLEAARRATALTRQLLAFGRKQVLQPRRIDANELIAGVTTMLRRLIGEDIALETRLASEVWPVMADPGQLEQVLVNLAVNARDAMPEGGTLRLHTENVSLDAARARAYAGIRAGAYVSIVVEDTGAGIDPSLLPMLFEPFFTTKGLGEGTGLGLATVYGIVKQSGGHVYAESVVGAGSRFTIFLPSAGTPGESGAGASEPAPPPGSETILLVEDEPAVRAAIRRMLERRGYAVYEADGSDQALRVLESSSARVDLVLTDVVMPGRNGRALGERIAERWPAMRVMYMSGYTDDEILRRGLARRGASILEKPFTSAQLALAVRRAIDAVR